MKSMRWVSSLLLLLVVLLVPLAGCSDSDGPTDPERETLRLTATSPVQATAGPRGLECAAVDLEIRDLVLARGEVVRYVQEIVRVDDGAVVNMHRGPEQGGVHDEVTVPRGGVLALDTGLCWLGEPKGTAIAYRVTVTVEPGHRQGTLRLPMRDWRELL
jgi:hypothetical protein